MLIPSIDLKGGSVVQLVQGERFAIADADVFKWVRRFERFPKVQVIDLDAATGSGDNTPLVRQIARSLSCRVGGGVRTIERAREMLDAGAQQAFDDVWIAAGRAEGGNDLRGAGHGRARVGQRRRLSAPPAPAADPRG